MTATPRKIACSDIHGCYRTFKHALENLIKPEKEDHLYLLGDYINKGNDSRQMLDYLVMLKDKLPNLYLLMGNHEQMLLDALTHPFLVDKWIAKGGDNTLKSFGVQHIYEIPKFYIEFIKTFDYYIELENCFLVHAGFNFVIDNPFLDKEDMLNIREFDVDKEIVGDKVILHGHVPQPLNSIKNAVANRSAKIGIDGGCVYKNDPQMGNLVFIDLNTFELLIQENLEPDF